MSRSEAYGYAVARIRAMEHLLLDAGLYQRMLDVPDLSAVLKVLGETGYSRGFSGTEAAERYDAALEAELLATYEDLETFVPDRELINIFRIPYDFHNVKVLLKSNFNAKSGGKKRWDLMTRLGSIPVDDLTVRMESEEFALLPYGLAHLIPLCLSQWEQTRDLVEIERILDRGLFEAIYEEAAKLNEPGILAWVQARIDSENIRNLLRLRRFEVEPSKALSFLHTKGTIAPDFLLQLMQEPFESWTRILSFSDVGQALSKVEDEGDFDSLIVSLERTLDDYCREVLVKARYSSNAPENVLAYLWGKETEVKNIRTILVSKGMSSGKDDVRRLMRHGY